MDSERLLLSLKEAQSMTGLGRSTVLKMAHSGQIPSVKIGRRRLFPADKLRIWVASLDGTEPLSWSEIHEQTMLGIQKSMSRGIAAEMKEASDV